MPSHNTPPQNVASQQPSAQTPQPFQQSPAAHQQQQLLFQPQVLHHKLHTCNKASHHSYNPGLAPKASCAVFCFSCRGTTKLSAQHPGTTSPKVCRWQRSKKQLHNRQGLFLMQATRTPQERLPRAAILLQM